MPEQYTNKTIPRAIKILLLSSLFYVFVTSWKLNAAELALVLKMGSL